MTRNVIKLLPGTYVLSSNLMFAGGFRLDIYGDATVQGVLYLSSQGGNSQLRLRDLTVNGGAWCDSSSALVPVPTIDLENVNVNSDLSDTVSASRCIVNIRKSTLVGASANSRALVVQGNGGVGGQAATVDRATLIASSSGVDPTILVADGGSLRMTNSVVRKGSTTIGALAFGTNVAASSISFTTFHNTFLKCPATNLIVDARNNILLNETTGAPTDTVSGSACGHNFSVIKPQANAPSGANNILNIDPRFANAGTGDYHLVVGSPAIDAADPASTEAHDFEGTARPQGAGRDIGAFESH